MSPVYQPMTYDELGEIYREEKDSKSLTRCRSDLYKAIADLQTRLRQDYNRQIALDPDSVMAEGASQRIRNASSIIKAIIAFRTKKICNKAILSADGGSEELDALTPEERDFYNEIVVLMKHHMSTVDRLRGVNMVDSRIDEPPAKQYMPPEPEPEPPAVEEMPEPELNEIPVVDEEPEMFDEPIMDEPFDETPVQEEIPDEEVAETIEVPIPKSDTALIRILEDLPPFVGPDRDYELRKEDVVTLPRLMAQALINSEKAVEIDPSHRSSSCPPGTPDNLCSSF